MANQYNDKTYKKPDFLKALADQGGIIAPALKAVDIARSTYISWYKKDPDFALACDEIKAEQGDFTESRLMQNIKNGDVTSIIFYLKTRCMDRGWNEKYNLAKKLQPNAPESKPAHDAELIRKEVIAKREWIIATLTKQGIYSEELYMQTDLTARLLVQQDLLWDELVSEGFNFSTIETSREGSAREKPNEKVQTYINISNQAQMALKRLGMNLDTKDRKIGDSNTEEFLSKHKEE